MPNMPATNRACTALAPATLRDLNRRSGMSGFSMRASRTRNPTKSASDAAPNPSV